MAYDTYGKKNDDLIGKELRLPFVIEKDIDYYLNLDEKYKLLIKKAKEYGVDRESLDVLKEDTDKVLSSVQNYHDGNVGLAQKEIKELVEKCLNNPSAIKDIFKANLYFIGENNELPFFRARTSDKFQDFSPKEMLALPISLRGKTGSYRFSIPGFPCLYLSNTSYGCWLETGRPSEHDFNVSPVLIDPQLKLFDLSVKTDDLSQLKESDKDKVHWYLKLITLKIATSYVIKEENRTFKSEYIVSQLIMLSCKELGLDGVAYHSKRVSDEAFARCAINLVLFTPYDKREYSSLYEKIKINSSYNYSLFKQLLHSAKIVTEGVSVQFVSEESSINIGNYNHQQPYHETFFREFDEYLLKNWKKREIASSFYEDKKGSIE